MSDKQTNYAGIDYGMGQANVDKESLTLKSEVRIERLMGKRYKASIGMAQGVGSSESKARAICESEAVDILANQQSPRIEVRHGYLIISQVESSTSGWYLIKKLSNLTDGFLHTKAVRLQGGSSGQYIGEL